MIESLSPVALRDWLNDERDERPAPFLLDVREPNEYAYCHLDGATLISLRTIPQRLNEIPRDRAIIAMCHHGMRSLQAAQFLENAGFMNIYNLTGGVAAWADQVDPNFPRY